MCCRQSTVSPSAKRRLAVGKRHSKLSVNGALPTVRRRSADAQTADKRQVGRRFADSRSAHCRPSVGRQKATIVGAGSQARPRRQSRQPEWVRFQASPDRAGMETRPYDNRHSDFLDFPPKFFVFFRFFSCFSLFVFVFFVVQKPIFPKFLPQNRGSEMLKSVFCLTLRSAHPNPPLRRLKRDVNTLIPHKKD